MAARSRQRFGMTCVNLRVFTLGMASNATYTVSDPTNGDVTLLGDGRGSPGGDDEFAINLNSRGVAVPGEGFHVAFAAPSQEAVAAFYKAALEHGRKDNGGTGLHPEYGRDYYAAFVFDPDGYRVEAVIVGHQTADAM